VIDRAIRESVSIVRASPLLLALACTPRVEPEPEPAPALEATPAPAAPGPAPVVPAPAPVAPPAGPQAPATPAPAPIAALPPVPTLEIEVKLFPVVRADTLAQFHELADGTIVVELERRFVIVTPDGTMLRGKELDLRLPEAKLAEDLVDIEWIAGRWPDAAFAGVRIATLDRGKHDDIELYRWADGWTRVDNDAHGNEFSYELAAPWRDGSMIALRSYDAVREENPPTVAAYDVLGATDHSPPRIEDERIVFAALPDGHLLEVGFAGATRWWTPDATAPVRATLPPRPPEELDVGGVDLVDATHAWVWGATKDARDIRMPYLVAWNGSAWAAIDVPGCGSIADLEAEMNGTLWWITEAPRDAILCETELWRRTADGEIRRVSATASELDDPFVPGRIFVRSPHDVWMSAPDRWRNEVLWHSRPAEREVELTDDG
jgi:hypothetical protein